MEFITIKNVIHHNEFEDKNEENLNQVLLSLQMCMKEMMKIGGGNGYKMPHMDKQSVEWEGGYFIG